MEKEFFFFLAESYFKYNLMMEKATSESEKAFFALLKVSYYIQAKNVFNLFGGGNIGKEKLITENDERLKVFFKKMSDENHNKAMEKYIVWSENIKKMEQMLFLNEEEKKKKKFYICRSCGWIGTDEVPEKCPLCSEKIDK